MATLTDMLTTETKAAIYARGLAVAQALGLNVTSWVAGDPTRSLYHFLSNILETLEIQVAGYVSSGFLDYATGNWLTLLAEQLYGVTRTEATYASTTVRLTNGGGGLSHPDMRLALMLGFLAFTLITGLLLWARVRTALAEARLARLEFEALELGIGEE